MTRFLTGRDPAPPYSGDLIFDAYVDKVLAEGGGGWRPYLLRVLQGVSPNLAILNEYKAERANWIVSPSAYTRALLTPERIAEGKRQVATNGALQRIAARHGLPPEVLAAYWGAASDYGARAPRHDLITTLMTLGAYGMGRPWWQWDIYKATEMIASGRVGRGEARSFADGSMGQLRWFPDRYLELASDGDGDRRADIWRSPADALASVANVLARGWQAGEPWVYEVVDRAFDANDPLDQRRLRGNNFLLADFQRLDGKAWSEAERDQYVMRLKPTSAPGRVYAIGRNFQPLAYSLGMSMDAEEAHGWGIGVGLLANAIREG